MQRQKVEPSRSYDLFRKIPVLGQVFVIANAYAFKGEALGNARVASFSQWWNRIFQKMFYVVCFVSALVLVAPKTVCSLDWSPADSILSAYPSILGFGIGVYALMFVMPNDFLIFLSKRKKEGMSIGPEIIPVDMGYPLITYVIIMLIAAINKMFPETYYFKLISLWALFYGLAMTVELVSFLFTSSKMIQKINPPHDESSKKDE
ncbi:hypothetical protein SBX64_16140 [Vibrio rhizosphaerae]|uniref:Permease n=1 Tax=Vibrio rhizosphaerae TaxID=398736 RepID=A0ABU4IXE3_9VIBR|nr:hypothetical protein [Vibrio rhizosphaerae]MDW6094070.1 hypothetical protein [Vibrio rhizosphaerae]